MPVAVTAVSGERLDALGAVTIQGMRGYIPNVQIQNFSNTPHGAVFNIRGMGVIEPDPYGGTTVVVTQDEVPQFFNMVSLLDTYDIERVEVLRGAQGTLFGANSTGGVIQAVSRRPQTDERSFDAYASYGNYDRVDVRGAINLPLIQDELALRVALSHHQRDGFITNVVDDKPIGDKDRTALRMSLLWEGSDRFDLTLIGEYSAHRDGTPHNINGSVPGEALHVPEGTIPARRGTAHVPISLPHSGQALQSSQQILFGARNGDSRPRGSGFLLGHPDHELGHTGWHDHLNHRLQGLEAARVHRPRLDAGVSRRHRPPHPGRSVHPGDSQHLCARRQLGNHDRRVLRGL